MRLFLAASVPENISKEISNLLVPFKNDYPDYRWVQEENYHLTIFFLGEREEAKKSDIVEGIEQIVFDIPSTIISAHKLKVFVNGSELTIYIEMYKNRQFDIVEKRISQAISNQTSPRKKYIPHLTIARCKLPSKQQYFHLKKKLERTKIDIEFLVNQIHLYQSFPGSSYPEYKILHSFKLH